jgi:hypothetical protein
MNDLRKVKVLGSGRYRIVPLVKDRETRRQFAVKDIQLGAGFDEVVIREVEVLIFS